MLNAQHATLVEGTAQTLTLERKSLAVLVKNFTSGVLSVAVNGGDIATDYVQIAAGAAQRVAINMGECCLISSLTVKSTGAGDVEAQGILY